MSALATSPNTVEAEVTEIGRRARAASALLALASSDKKRDGLVRAAQAIRADRDRIIEANQRDLTAAGDLSAPMRDRLALDAKRVSAMADGVAQVADLPDPVGEVTARWTRPNGLVIERVRVPLGVIGIIYESRPNVTADAASLCLKSGNAAILRGGSESFHSSAAILDAFRRGLREAGLPEDAVQSLPMRDRAAVGAMLRLTEFIDVIVPRGGKGLMARVIEESRIPVLKHLDGNCHVYIHGKADFEKSRAVVMNAKLRRTSVCGAAESLLCDRALVDTHLRPILAELIAGGCEIRGDETVQALESRAKPASDSDWSTEYLDAILAVRVVDGLDQAIDHINRYGSHHTDAIMTEDAEAARRFLAEIDSAIVLHNASTQFADGGEFGFGAEIGISTGKLHARGPVGAAELTSYKYAVHGNGQVRP